MCYKTLNVALNPRLLSWIPLQVIPAQNRHIISTGNSLKASNVKSSHERNPASRFKGLVQGKVNGSYFYYKGADSDFYTNRGPKLTN